MLLPKPLKSTLKWVALTLYFSILIIIMTYPLVLKMGHTMIGEIGDNIYFVWMIGWMKKAIFELHVNPFDVWFLNYPEGWNMAYTEITPIMLALAIPFAFLGGPTFAYNAAMMLSFVLAGLFMFLWVEHLTERKDAALVAGTIYAFVPYHFAHFLIGHLNLSGIQWFPLYFMGLYDLLEQNRVRPERSNWKPAILAGISLGLIGWTSQYYLYMTLFISLAFALTYIIRVNWKMITRKLFWLNWMVMGLAALPLVGVAILPYVTLAGQGGLPDRGIGITEMYSASPTDFVLPSTLHFIWGQWVGATFNRDMWVEGTLYVGMVALVLAVIAWLKRKESRHVHLMPALLVSILTATILAMGIDLHWNGEVVRLATPSFLIPLIGKENFPIVLPGFFLFKYFPFFAKLRALMRFGVFNLVLISAMAGLGSAWVLNKVRPSRRLAVTVLILLLVGIDFFPRPFNQFAEVAPRPVDSWLAQQPGEGAVVQMPFIKAEDQDQTYFTLTYNKPYIGGFFNAFPPHQYQEIKPALASFPDEQSVALLKKLGTEYVLVDEASYTDMDAIRSQCEALGLEFKAEIGDQMVFVLR